MTINDSEYRVTAPTEPDRLAATTASVNPETHDSDETAMMEAESGERSNVLSSIMNAIVKASSVAELVRFTGAGLIVFAVSLFLMQGMDATNDLQRFHLLLLQTGFLGAAGFAVGYVLKEPRGARVFFSLGLISIPANLAVLGAMIYSVLPAGQRAGHYPDYASWQASSVTEIVFAIGTGAIVLVPMALFAFSVFARQSRGWLSAGYLSSSAVLLLPVRDSLLVTLISVAAVVALLGLLRQRRSAGITLLTTEERFAQLLLFLPPVLMMARSAMLYSSEFNMLAMSSSVVYLTLRYCSQRSQSATWLDNSVHLLSALAATWLAGLLSSMAAINGLYSGANLLFPLLLGVLLLDLCRRVPSRTVLWWIHTGWALVCLPAFVGNYVLWSGASTLVLTLLICALMIGSGRMFNNRAVIVLGVMALLGNLFLQGTYLIQLVMGSSWMTLAIMGALVVVTGSLIERFGVTGRLKAQAWVEKMLPRTDNAGLVEQGADDNGSPAMRTEERPSVEQDLAA